MNDPFKQELTTLINRHSKENGRGTPDWMLAEYLVNCLEAYDLAVSKRKQWYGREASIGALQTAKG